MYRGRYQSFKLASGESSISAIYLILMLILVLQCSTELPDCLVQIPFLAIGAQYQQYMDPNHPHVLEITLVSRQSRA